MILFLAITLFFSAPVFANNNQDTANTIRQILDDRDRQIKDLLGPKGQEYTETQREQLKAIINDIVDYPAMAEVALADHFTTITQEQRTEFVEVFAQVIRQHSLGQLDIYRAEIAYESIEVFEDGTALVVTIATLDNVRTPVQYRMHKVNGVWMIADMSVDNVWTAESYRRSFQNIIRRRGFDALLDSLRRRVES